MSDLSSPATPPPGDAFRPHSYDGIREYDKRLPNWWLWTLYLTVIFAAVYWFYYFTTGIGPDDRTVIARELGRIEAAKLAATGSLSDEVLWKMSRTPGFVEAGRATFNANCAVCHLTSLRGKAESPSAVGASLIGTRWVYGGRPLDLIATVTKGTPRGMPPWGPVLGSKRITEVVAYVLSYHEPGEPVEIVPSSAPGVK
ncbi:MAG: cbb3-type cytochrome c oxidase N-terminal domain-containing protein [Opitutaceae bacterium]|nr:cbb3-type cytochrome c oxidase N-terminal domain-containing protein [Opitutaceae bacterium]